MTILHSLLAATATTTKASSKSNGGSFQIVFLAVVAAAFYFLIIRPRSKRQKQAKTQAAAMEIGDSVMSIGGIKGVIVDMDDTDVYVEVSPGVVLTFIRRAVNLQPGVAPGAARDDEPHDHDTFSDEPAAREIDPLDRPPPGTAGPDDPEDRPGTGAQGH